MLFEWYVTALYIHFFFYFLNRIYLLLLLSLLIYMLVYVFCKRFDIYIDIILEYHFISRICSLFYLFFITYCGFFLGSLDWYSSLRILRCDVDTYTAMQPFEFETFYIFFDTEILCSFFNFDYAFFYVSFSEFVGFVFYVHRICDDYIASFQLFNKGLRFLIVFFSLLRFILRLFLKILRFILDFFKKK